MAKEITLKDVLYALEYGRETLERTPPATVGGAVRWTLMPSGNKVKTSVADHACASGSLVMRDASRDGRQTYCWRAAA